MATSEFAVKSCRPGRCNIGIVRITSRESELRIPFTGLSDDVDSTHVRSISMESRSSRYSDDEPQASGATPSFLPKSPRPPRLRLDNLSPSSSSDVGPSPDSYLPTPAESISSNEDSTIQSSSSRQHGRNASYAGGGHMSSRSHLAKKSLPDMRSAKLMLRSAPPLSGPSRAVDQFAIPSPPHRQESDSSNGSFGHFQPKILKQNDIMSSPVALERPAPPMDVERNSYFRRFSTLKPGSLAKTVPAPLLALVDAVRGILFGVSQIYQTLQHYTVYAIDERLSAVLLKVLDPASAYMVQLINALDRFDTLSKRTLPPPSVCRAVVESCRDNVTVFGKAVGVLSLQLKVLATHDDVRYTRQMLIVLYGAMAEISSAWQDIAGRIEEVKPLLRDHRPPPASKYPHGPNLRAPSMPFSADISVVSPATSSTTSPTPHLPSHPIPRSFARSVSPHSAADGRTRMSRRHAGSFSYKDVELGKLLPSNTDIPQLSAGILGTSSQAPILRGARRPSALAPSSSSISISQEGTIRPSTSVPRLDSHTRQSSTSSFMLSAYSPSLVLRAPPDILSNTSTLVDKEALEAMKLAVQAAPSVWAMTDEMLEDHPDLKEELNDMLARAKDVTDKLRNDIRAVENGDATADRKTLRSDAHVFANVSGCPLDAFGFSVAQYTACRAQTVIHLFNVIKTHGSAHSMSPVLRTSMVKLTNATEEYIMLLHVSSFSPTPRPYSPMVSPLPPSSATEDGRLGANLSRSRSFVPSASAKLTPTLREPPRSALPHNQTFKLTTPPRFVSVRSPDE